MSARVHLLPPAGKAQASRTARVLLALARLKRAAQRAALRYVIESNGRYIERCAAEGLMDSASLREARRQLAADHVRLALLED